MNLMFGIDGYPVLYSHQEFLADMIARYFENSATEYVVSPKFDGREYSGINLDLKSDLKGWYALEHTHPITGEKTINIGSTIYCVRRRINEKIRHVIIGVGTQDAFARDWINRVGKNVDYTCVKFLPMERAEIKQSFLRDIEGYLIKWYRNKYGNKAVINIEENPTVTLNTQIVETTPALEGI